MAEGQQEFPLHTTRFEITHRILLALLSQGKLNKYGIIVFAQMENNPFAKQKRYKREAMIFIYFCGSLRQDPKVKLNEQRASRSFTCTPLSLKPRTLLEVPVSQNGLISESTSTRQ
jgi:hypothetical protein